jgi:glycosyltransferase involved in cell wall biosynthesis
MFVHTSRVESFCQVGVEALALGIPVVSSDVGVLREIMGDDLTGRLFPPGDEPALVGALQAMLQQRDRWPLMGQQGRQRIELFDGAQVIPRYEAQYLAWLGERRGHAGDGRLASLAR